jgi:hypothetical protein
MKLLGIQVTNWPEGESIDVFIEREDLAARRLSTTIEHLRRHAAKK